MQKHVVQVTYNWFTFEKGEQFYDFTINKMIFPRPMSNDVLVGKTVKEIEIQSDKEGNYAIVVFDDDTVHYQRNLNSWTYADSERETRDDKNK